MANKKIWIKVEVQEDAYYGMCTHAEEISLTEDKLILESATILLQILIDTFKDKVLYHGCDIGKPLLNSGYKSNKPKYSLPEHDFILDQIINEHRRYPSSSPNPRDWRNQHPQFIEEQERTQRGGRRRG